MTVMAEQRTAPCTDEHPQMSAEDFEQIAAGSPETVTLEFIDGRIGVKAVPDGNHDEIIKWLQKKCMQFDADLWLYAERGLVVESYRKGRARPDGTLALDGHFTGAGTWAEPDGVLMTVEVTSHDADTNRRDREEKPAGYAAAGIPVYLLVDRERRSVTVHSRPDTALGRYRDAHTVPFGEAVKLPAPVDAELDTAPFTEFAD